MGRSKKSNDHSWIIDKNKIEKTLILKDRINKLSIERAKKELPKLNDVYEKHKNFVDCIEL